MTGVSASSAVTGRVIVDTQAGSGPAGNGTPNHIGVQGMTASNGLTRQQADELGEQLGRLTGLMEWLKHEPNPPRNVQILSTDFLSVMELLHRVHRLRVVSQREVARLSRILTNESNAAPGRRRRAS